MDHKHKYKLIFRRHAKMYKFQCVRCEDTIWCHKLGFWFPFAAAKQFEAGPGTRS